MYVNDNKNTITKLPGTQIVCAKCDKQFSTKRGLHYHDQSVHKGIRYPCDKCDYKATKTSHLKRHVKDIHECRY